MVTLFVSNLHPTVIETDLVEAIHRLPKKLKLEFPRIIRNKHTGKSRKFGFLHFPQEHNAKEIAQYLNGIAIKGRKAVVQPSTNDISHTKRAIA